MADISKTVSIIFLGEDKASATIGGLESKLGGLGTSADEAKTKAGGLGDELEKVGDSEVSVLRAVDALKALAASLVVKAFIDANIEAEKFEKAMVLLKGSSEEAGKEFEYVKAVAETLGLRIFDVANSYVNLTAATKGTALEGQATRDIFEAVAKAMSTLGKSSADTEGALLAIQQMVSKGTVSMEELRGQLGERLPGAFQTAAKAMGLTTEELTELVSSGTLTAEEFLPKLAAALRETFGDTSYIEGYQAAWNRLQNSLDDAFVQLGQGGVFDALTKGVEIATASVVGAVAAFNLLGEIAGAVAGAIATGDFSLLGTAIDEAMTRAAQRTQGVRDALLEVKQEAVNLKYEGEQAGNKTAEGMDKAKLSAEDLAKASKEVDAALKALGIDPKQFKDPLDEVLAALDKLANNPAVTGDQFLSGFLVTLDKIKSGPEGLKDIERVVVALAKAQEAGVLTTEQYTAALQALEVKNSGAWEGMIRTADAGTKNADALKKQADEARKAEEETRKYALELEKLASNERIKLIEARVQLNVAELQEDTKRIQAAFESINTTVNSTGDLLGELFGALTNADSWSELRLIEKQIDMENRRRDDALRLQQELTQAQIANLNARTNSLNRGEALIRVDGAGLQPHLEAFMWEILQAIQVRVNEDGLDMLVGTSLGGESGGGGAPAPAPAPAPVPELPDFTP